MRVLVLGATGFVGRTLVLVLQAHGHEVAVLARDVGRAATTLPAGVTTAAFGDDAELATAVANAQAIVNLAGESIASGRWTRRRRERIEASRLDVTRRLVAAIDRRGEPLPVLVSASATGWYGDRGDETLGERSAPGQGFAADLCHRWEAAALAARASRVAIARFGVVLGLEGGALGTLRRIYRAGLGGPLGDGAAWFPWIHVEDAARAILHVIAHPIAGPVAVVAPEQVRQRDFAAAYASSLHRPAVVRTPRIALEAVLGEAATVLLGSQRVVPGVLARTGFAFRFPTLEAALADLASDEVIIERARDLPDSLYLLARGARYVLRATTELAAPLETVFGVFSRPENLAALTPPQLGFEITTPGPIELASGALIDYRIRFAGLPLRWRTRIEDWQPGCGFVDSQLLGPYRSWWHEHRFSSRGSSTVMEDIVHFSPPLGPLGQLAVEDVLRRIFAYRRAMIRARFATP